MLRPVVLRLLRRGCLWLLSLTFAGVGLTFAWAASRTYPGTLGCPEARGSYVWVDTRTRTLALCRGTLVVSRHSVRLGWGGKGKMLEGDQKTPLGTYDLGSPRASTLFGSFIPVGYPRLDQQRLGYSGGAIGIHGPHRIARWLGSWVNTFDTTDGCIGIASDEEMALLARFVREASHPRITLR